MCGMSTTAFRNSLRAGFLSFKMYRISAFRTGFKRADVEAWIEAQEERIVTLAPGESLKAAGVER